ncbi:hypothetical protein BJX66DRAFT_350518 [Aspergillus keveii]|uniref:Heterokaryon incompatibility domain-containing protein n=1 Tax=Aspergillus keveii TaxID=714993 RepID=A0ABR4G965_9EURO
MKNGQEPVRLRLGYFGWPCRHKRLLPGLVDLSEKVVEYSENEHNCEQLLDLREKRKDLKDLPDLFGALCFRDLIKRPKLAREVTFSYTVKTGGNPDLPGGALIEVLAALAFGIDKPDEGTDSPEKYTFRSEYFRQSLVAAAFFSARSLLEPLGELAPSDADPPNPYTFRAEYPKQRIMAAAFFDGRRLELEELEEMEAIALSDAAQGEARNKWTIGKMIETLFSHELSLDTDLAPWKRGLEKWRFLLRDENFKRLEPHLSVEQANVARILLEWWHGLTDFEANSAQSRAAVLQLAVADDDGGYFPDLANIYQNRMVEFMSVEFCGESDGDPEVEVGARSASFEQAAVQRLSMAVYRSLINLHSQGTETGVSQVEYDRTIGASVSPCPWLPTSVSQEDMPYYLWDIQERRTCVAGELNAPSVSVNGVKEWLIPQNTKFELTDLPDILASAPLDTHYVWLDLLCIPQEPDSDRLRQISVNKIARQAKIFRGAKNTIAWLKDVFGLDSPGAKADLELIPFLGNNIYGEVNRWFSSLWTLQELCLRPDLMFCDRLWNFFAVDGTKETAVRLDDLIALRMHLDPTTVYVHRDALDRAGVDLSVEEDQPTMTDALDSLFLTSGLDEFPNASVANRAEAIMSAVGAVDWYRTANDRPKSIVQGSQRSNSSLLAIRSTAPSNSYPPAFLQEVAEKVGPQFYATVFSPDGLTRGLFRTLGRNRDTPYPEGPATMLPFGFDVLTKNENMTARFGLHGTPHPSVRTWTINADLSVDIHQAAIISYTGQVRSPGDHTKLLAKIHAPDADGSSFRQSRTEEEVDLDFWVDGFVPQTRNFAVVYTMGLLRMVFF